MSEQPERPVFVVVSVELSEKEYWDLWSNGWRLKKKKPTVLFSGQATFSAAIRQRLGWTERPYRHTKDPEMISAREMRERHPDGPPAKYR